MHLFNQNVQRTRVLELLQSVICHLLTTVFLNSAKTISTKCDRYGFIEVIKVGEILFDLLKAFHVSTCILSLLLQVFKIVFQSLYSFLKLR